MSAHQNGAAATETNGCHHAGRVETNGYHQTTTSSETNGYHAVIDDTSTRHNLFEVPKTPEKPLKSYVSHNFENIELEPQVGVTC